MKCKYCKGNLTLSNVITISTQAKINKHGACIECLSYLTIMESLLEEPYLYFVYKGVIYEINDTLDRSGKTVYIRFKDGRAVNENLNRLITVLHSKIPPYLIDAIPDNCIIEGLPTKVKRQRLPNLWNANGKGKH